MQQTQQPRVPRGTRDGGRFARPTRGEAAVALADVSDTALVRLPPPVRRVLDAITTAGGRPLLVGGCVRDALLDPTSAPKDIDVEVYGLEPDRLTAALRTVARVDEVGQSFAVLKVDAHGEQVDVALPRREVSTGPGPLGDIHPGPAVGGGGGQPGRRPGRGGAHARRLGRDGSRAAAVALRRAAGHRAALTWHLAGGCAYDPGAPLPGRGDPGRAEERQDQCPIASSGRRSPRS